MERKSKMFLEQAETACFMISSFLTKAPEGEGGVSKGNGYLSCSKERTRTGSQGTAGESGSIRDDDEGL